MAKRTNWVAWGTAAALAVAVLLQQGISLGSDIVRVVPSTGRRHGAFLGYACGYTNSGRAVGYSGRSYHLGWLEVEVWHRDYLR